MMKIRFVKSMLLGLAAATVLSAAPVSANPAMLFDVNSGAVIEHQEAFKRWHPASLTKLMTAYTTFRAVKAGELALNSPIKISRKAAAFPPAKMGYKPGSVLTLDNALKIIMVKSANDVAAAIGENVGGTPEAFAARMNAEAQRLGMSGSHWVNANGLHDPEQYTTARDLAVLVRAIRLEYPEYAAYFDIEGIIAGKAKLKNFNPLVGRFPGTDGMKTGFVCESGFNLIATATRDGRTLAAIVLGADSPDKRAEEAAKMLQTGFVRNGASVSVTGLAPYGDSRDVATSMREEVCSPKAKHAASDGPAPTEAGAAPDKVSIIPEMTRQRNWVTVSLGGATGPKPKALGGGDIVVDTGVPLPTWRPDRPAPVGAAPLAANVQARS
ncbi:D-alanyl-D-alanine carboxypeptidase family protein [Aminobacter carboxidus]|uniref:D-alanyl-D-alanine carboxypeptidase n=1 Tax=Aminobacter carboxidus TaxID=376165 RepID=A0ABR9GUK6_9HYPH|nr:D-alanyl-D-alanine carboxypeptidase family protein [Aminobacter carboxidus]MBE1207356.1 D-alanyl-D-alanine carboxypeptidase [Aminobacter carboxidus]